MYKSHAIVITASLIIC